jgi:predicted Zn-dependent protease
MPAVRRSRPIHALAIAGALVLLPCSTSGEGAPDAPGARTLAAGIDGPEAAGNAPDDPATRALAAEIDRAMAALGASEAPPYHVGAELTETRAVRIVGESGGLHDWSPSVRRWLDVDVRIGSRELDSSHALRSGNERPQRGGTPVPLTDDPAALRHVAWLEIDERYRAARERWAKVKAEHEVLVEEEPSQDLAPVEPARYSEPPPELRFDARAMERLVQRASRVLAEEPVVLDGAVSFSGSAQTTWFVSSEGSRIRHGGSHYRIDIDAQTIADDGDLLQLYASFDAHEADRLPPVETVVARARELVSLLAQLRAAPLEEPYSGPAILSDRAAGVFFHEIFGHRVEGHRLKLVDNAQTFRNRVGERILPEFLSVVDDPTLARAAGTDLNGFYRFDNQGVPAGRVVLVEDGVLEGFLESRSPGGTGTTSNGHGRRQQGEDPVSRQGNLIVEASHTVPDAELRRMLIERARAEGRDYALRIEEIQGGFTFTGRTIPNAFNVNAVLAWRVWVDGRPDELVRGVDLIGTPLEAFSKIVAAGELHSVFNGACGAESGWVPVSGVAPSLLLASIETQRKQRHQTTPPLLPPPLARPAEARE